MGCFDYKGGTALYVARNSIASAGTVTLHFNGNYGYDIVTRGETSFKAGESVNLYLEAGEGVLITLR